MKRTIIAAIIAMAAACAIARDTYTVKVVDKDGKPVPDVLVVFDFQGPGDIGRTNNFVGEVKEMKGDTFQIVMTPVDNAPARSSGAARTDAEGNAVLKFKATGLKFKVHVNKNTIIMVGEVPDDEPGRTVMVP